MTVRKGSDNAAKQSTNAIVSAAKALRGLQDLIAAAVEAALRGGVALPADLRAGLEAAVTAAAAGSGRGATASLPSAPSELVQPRAWHAKNTLVRDALREITTRQSQREREERASAAAAVAAVAAVGGDPAAAALAIAATVAKELPAVPLVDKSLPSPSPRQPARPPGRTRNL